MGVTQLIQQRGVIWFEHEGLGQVLGGRIILTGVQVGLRRFAQQNHVGRMHASHAFECLGAECGVAAKLGGYGCETRALELGNGTPSGRSERKNSFGFGFIVPGRFHLGPCDECLAKIRVNVHRS